jgi:intracellular septation protein
MGDDGVGGSTGSPRADQDLNPNTARPEPVEGRKPKTGWANVLVDWGPVLVFFGTYHYLAPADSNDALAVVGAAIGATAVFIVAAIVALLVSKLVLGGISRMLGLSTLLIVGFCALTVLLSDPFWIQLKPTAFYVFFGAVLLGGWMRGKALLQWALEAAFEGLSHEGWLKLSRNWGLFFFFLAALNEVLRRIFNVENGNFGTWVDLKLWLFVPLSFLFIFTQLPMLLRHGLSIDDKAEVLENPPPE